MKDDLIQDEASRLVIREDKNYPGLYFLDFVHPSGCVLIEAYENKTDVEALKNLLTPLYHGLHGLKHSLIIEYCNQIEAIIDEIVCDSRLTEPRGLSEFTGILFEILNQTKKVRRLQRLKALSYQKDKFRRERDAARKRAARATQRAAKPVKENISASRPWEAEGISRRTWYRRLSAPKRSSVQ